MHRDGRPEHRALGAATAIALAGVWLAIAIAAPPARAGGSCEAQAMACGNACASLSPDVDALLRCTCQCIFEACECQLGGTQFANQCIESVLQSSCNGDSTGLLQSNPVLPTVLPGGGFDFDDAPTGAWCDPPATDSFVYTMTAGSRFTAIVDFPTGFSEDFEVSVDGQSLGTFGPGEAVAFAPPGVAEFTVSGISPAVDSEDPQAFPLRLAFDTPTADFTMVAPEPGGGALAAAAAVALAALRRMTRPSPPMVGVEGGDDRVTADLPS